MTTKRRTGELTPQTQSQVTVKEARFLALCHRLGWGTLMVLVKDGQPTRSRILSREYSHDTELPEDVVLLVSETSGVAWKGF